MANNSIGNSIGTSTAEPGWFRANTGWVSDFCDSYAPSLLNIGTGLLIVGALLGIVVTVIALISALAAPKKPDAVATMSSNSVAVLAGLQAFLEAIAKAPPWLALFGAGVLLLWMAGSINPEVCGINKLPATSEARPSAGGTRAGATRPSPAPAPDPQGNAASGAGAGNPPPR